jgi:plasmid stabilization system protein ParE
MKPAHIHPQAEVEADEAFEWYWTRSNSAALGFDAELRGAFGTLRRSPRTGTPYLHGTRRVILSQYPFSVVYRELLNEIQIIAIAHAKRRPGYWSQRL